MSNASAIARRMCGHKERGAGYSIYATYSGSGYAALDGSETATPVTLEVAATSGDRVRVQVSKHRAAVVGNVTQGTEA